MIEEKPHIDLMAERIHELMTELDSLRKRVSEIACKTEADYPNVADIPAYEQLWAIEQGNLGRMRALEEWRQHADRLKVKADKFDEYTKSEGRTYFACATCGRGRTAKSCLSCDLNDAREAARWLFVRLGGEADKIAARQRWDFLL